MPVSDYTREHWWEIIQANSGYTIRGKSLVAAVQIIRRISRGRDGNGGNEVAAIGRGRPPVIVLGLQKIAAHDYGGRLDLRFGFRE